ncbi:MAG TPA: hypothetical protein VG847_09425 [Chitinophagaceae bacterium]|nr:hypothetical protein [Chitinophagaceae bacterium]
MENYYTAYTKVVQDTTFYFVKKYITFPEYKDVPGVLESYGMHTKFERACDIAGLHDEEIRKNLLEDIQSDESTAKVVYMDVPKGMRAAK